MRRERHLRHYKVTLVAWDKAARWQKRSGSTSAPSGHSISGWSRKAGWQSCPAATCLVSRRVWGWIRVCDPPDQSEELLGLIFAGISIRCSFSWETDVEWGPRDQSQHCLYWYLMKNH